MACSSSLTNGRRCQGDSGGGSDKDGGSGNDWTYVIMMVQYLPPLLFDAGRRYPAPKRRNNGSAAQAVAAGLYVVGGVAYNYKVKEEIALPHVAFWQNFGGLVRAAPHVFAALARSWCLLRCRWLIVALARGFVGPTGGGRCEMVSGQVLWRRVPRHPARR